MTRSRFTPVMLGVQGALALALIYAWVGPRADFRTAQWQAPAPQAPNLDDLRAAMLMRNPQAQISAPDVLERPLFSTTRTAAAAGESAAGEADAPPPQSIDQVVLTGIIESRGLHGVLATVENEARFVRAGERIGDWELLAIRGREVTFGQGDDRRTLKLPFANTPEPAASAPAPKPVEANKTAPVKRPVPVEVRPGASAPQDTSAAIRGAELKRKRAELAQKLGLTVSSAPGASAAAFPPARAASR